jgi:hypothetical protein
MTPIYDDPTITYNQSNISYDQTVGGPNVAEVSAGITFGAGTTKKAVRRAAVGAQVTFGAGVMSPSKVISPTYVVTHIAPGITFTGGSVSKKTQRTFIAPQISFIGGNATRSSTGVVPGATPVASYRLALATRSATGLGTPIISDVLRVGVPMDNEQACKWGRGNNTAGSIEFTLPIDACSPTDFDIGKRELHLYRNDGSGEKLVWSGRLWTADVQTPWVRFGGFGFYEDLRHREMSDDFFKHQQEQRSIAWDAIAYTQAQTDGGLGITLESTAGSGINRTLTVCAEERKPIADIIEDMASADDGFDFEVGPDKVWRTWTPKRGADLSGVVHLDTTSSILDISYTEDATTVENDVAGIGAKGDCEPITFIRKVDTVSRAGYGLMQGTVQRTDMKQDDDMLTAVTRERLALQKVPRKQPTVRCFQGLIGVSPLTGDFGIGDTILVTASYGFATFSDPFRVLAYDVSFDRLGYEMIDFTLDATV